MSKLSRARVPQIFSIAEFCRTTRISRSMYFALKDKGLGPRTMTIGRAVRISSLAVKEWIHRMESEEARDFNSKKKPPKFSDW
jgi:predicted DNA-binding transcriptional regulator AlpA